MNIEVSPKRQQLTVFEGKKIITTFPVSTSKFGLGETEGSHQTPRGHHTITEKFGADACLGTIFKGRIPTGEIWTPDHVTEEDLILTRILWLSGKETQNQNSHNRYIYLHGTNQESLISTPASIGCIRLKNDDIITLFDMVDIGTSVTILDKS